MATTKGKQWCEREYKKKKKMCLVVWAAGRWACVAHLPRTQVNPTLSLNVLGSLSISSTCQRKESKKKNMKRNKTGPKREYNFFCFWLCLCFICLSLCRIFSSSSKLLLCNALYALTRAEFYKISWFISIRLNCDCSLWCDSVCVTWRQKGECFAFWAFWPGSHWIKFKFIRSNIEYKNISAWKLGCLQPLLKHSRFCIIHSWLTLI